LAKKAGRRKRVSREELRIHKGHIAACQRHLEELIARTESGLVNGIMFDAADCLALRRILQEIKKGRDPRKWFDIKPKRGAPSGGPHSLVAADYWAQRMGEPKHNDIEARKIVAGHFGLGEDRVYQIARPLRKQSEQVLAQMGREGIENMVRIVLGHRAFAALNDGSIIAADSESPGIR
jgi:hypothetical protein